MSLNIAFFDSGQGGLTVWEAVIRKFPNLNTNYLGDNARHPYGNKGAETVTRYTSEALFHLVNLNADFVVVACGTASSVAVKSVKNVFRVPIIGIVEGLCAEAVKHAGEKTIAVLGTRFTVASGSFHNELSRLGAKKIWQRACPLFVPLVEEGVTPGPMASAAAEMYLGDIPADVGVVILGCTHYPRLSRSIADFLFQKFGRPIIYKSAEGETLMNSVNGNRENPICLVDSSLPIVNAVDAFLAKHPERQRFFGGEQNIFCSDAPQRFREVAKLFANKELPEVQLVRLGN